MEIGKDLFDGSDELAKLAAEIVQVQNDLDYVEKQKKKQRSQRQRQGSGAGAGRVYRAH